MAPLRSLALAWLLGLGDAWGPDGHTIVAHIGEQFLTPEANASLQEILGGVSITKASDWNDDYDHTPAGRWSEPLHFINYPGRSCNFSWAQDCVDDLCNVGAIVNYTRQLSDTSLNKETRLTALKFVIHMMGDLHQPLHVASQDDEGGNLIRVGGNRFSPEPRFWLNKSKTLHSQWDGDVVIQSIYDLTTIASPAQQSQLRRPFPIHYHKWAVLANVLEQRLATEWSAKRAAWQQPVSSPSDEGAFRAGLAEVADETAMLGCVYAYSWANGTRVQPGDILDRGYFERAKPIVAAQLARGGVRLAEVLNFALAKTGRTSAIFM